VSATKTTRLGVLGGMFDPIHNGHMAAGVAAQLALGLDEIALIPSRQPPHRPSQPVATAADRLAMAKLAAESQKSWTVSEVELTRAGTTYTFDTLTELEKWGQTPRQVFFILGADAFAEIDTWSRFPQVLDLANFVVIARPGFTLANAGNKLPSLAARMTTPEGFRADEAREGTAIILVEATTPPVSSTEIRRRISRGASIADLVPAGVDSYIRDHRLYLAPTNGAGR
jgi:nicotinate-nucleotide adenylyltransferase